MHLLKYNLFAYCLYLFWAFDRTNASVISFEPDPIVFFSRRTCLSDLSCWRNAPFDKPPPYGYFSQILHIQPLFVWNKYNQLWSSSYFDPEYLLSDFSDNNFGCENKFPHSVSLSSEEVSLISSSGWFQYSLITSSSTVSLLLAGFWIRWNVLDSSGDST